LAELNHVLVTGATGLLGGNLVRLLMEQGRRVRVLTRAQSDPRALEGLDAERFEGDVCDAESVRAAANGVDCIAHCAAYVQIGWSHMDTHRAVNFHGAKNVADVAREFGLRMVHVSTVDAIGLGTNEQPADEFHFRPHRVLCPYVVTKGEAEEMIRRQVDQGLDAVIVNPTFMLGPFDWKPSSGRMLLEVARHGPLAAPRGGNNFCDARDVAAGVIGAAERGEPGERYILGGENLTFFDAWRLFARAAGSRRPKVRLGPVLPYLTGKFGDIAAKVRGREGEINSAAVQMSMLPHYFKSDRAERELGYTHRPLEETVADAWHWFCDNGYVKKTEKK